MTIEIITVTVEVTTEGSAHYGAFYSARAKQLSPTAEFKETEHSASYDRNRAISYALAELAAMLGSRR